MALPEILDTGLTVEQIAEAFSRALNDMTDDDINEKFDEISAKILQIETRLTALESLTEQRGRKCMIF
ncbi:MAG: hypothetical protein K2J08_07850 [Ruminococcus sp.]|nr:hypothetical protein [Ruminococcus sp.]